MADPIPDFVAWLEQQARAQHAPTNADIRAAFGLKSVSTAAAYVQRAEARGLVRVHRGQNTRVIEAADRSWRTAGEVPDQRHVSRGTPLKQRPEPASPIKPTYEVRQFTVSGRRNTNAGFFARKDFVPPPSDEEAARLVAEWLERNTITVCPPTKVLEQTSYGLGLVFGGARP